MNKLRYGKGLFFAAPFVVINKKEMKKGKLFSIALVLLVVLFSGCGKKDSPEPSPPTVPVTVAFEAKSVSVNGVTTGGYLYQNLDLLPVIKCTFDVPIKTATVGDAVTFKSTSGISVPYQISFQNGDSIFIIQPSAPLQSFTKYTVFISTALQSKESAKLKLPVTVSLATGIDSTDKFPRITDDSLLTLVQKQTFTYFWGFGHPVSGCARERNTSGETITTGGTGFGIMTMLAAVNRGFISRSEALTRITTIADFYKNKCTAYHGAYAHWINGSTGATIPFSSLDDGADLVETSYLMQGLLCARQYFTSPGADETSLRNTVNLLWDAVDWNWFQQGGQNVLYWHWSPNNGWAINLPVRGWNEALIVYALAASSRTHAISKTVYDNGWASNGAIKNGKAFYNITLPLGEDFGGPLFFAQYSFLGINPTGLSDAYASDYLQQNTAHTDINYNYCVKNPKGYAGYGSDCWGLTASDENGGYSAHSPANDNGTITPTASISSLPYDTAKCMAALRFFYYKLGDKLWGDHGFRDAFNFTENWFADSYLAIDQGPEIIMIENMRSGLFWNLFMSCPEIKAGLINLGFQSPNL